jgi:dTDP-4-amino-4,6-dideoxygalactose transaminase
MAGPGMGGVRAAMEVPFRDLKRGIAVRRADWERAVVAAIDACDFGRPNRRIEAFEEAWADYCGVRHAVATSSGSTALLLCYLAFGIGEASEVISVANTFVATIEPVRMLGGRPVLADVDPHGYALDPGRLESAVTPRTRLIVPFHPFGRLAPMEQILEIAARRSIPVVEEACQAHGAERRGRKAGAFGAAAVFSFGPTKPLAGIGEGGAVVTDDDALARELRLLNNHGRWQGAHAVNGLNFRMHPIEATFLTERLRLLPGMLAERRAIAARYNAAFAGLGIARNPRVEAPEEHSYYLYVLEAESRERLTRRLSAAGIGWDIHYPVPIHRQPAHAELFQETRLPVTDRIQERIVSLPLINGLTDREVDRVIEVVAEAAGVA